MRFGLPLPLPKERSSSSPPVMRHWIRSFMSCVAYCSLVSHPMDSIGLEPPDLPALDVADALADNESGMQIYEELIVDSNATIRMVPIPSGSFRMGSPDEEEDRNDDEGPCRNVSISAFWMSECEITWDAYDVWMSDLDVFRCEVDAIQPTPREKLAETFQLSQPTKPYTDMTFGMGKRGYPAISMTQHAARVFCKWLSAKTGRYYRLPTEAEWEYACRAGTSTAYSFGDSPDELENHAWFFDNIEDGYEKVGKKEPNAWGLYDMHGNVAEWVLDQYDPEGYGSIEDQTSNPLAIPRTLYPRVVRGGSWMQDANECRSSSRQGSNEEWIQQDPQNPKSIWYLTDAQHIGFRIVRPLNEPTSHEKETRWDFSEPIQIDRGKTDDPTTDP